jgi:hypothetical protein
MIDIGIAVNGLIVDEVAFDQPGAWFLKCCNGHKGIFATTEMLEAGTVVCDECATDAAAYARLQARNKQVDEDIAAGMEELPGWLEKFGEARINHDR